MPKGFLTNINIHNQKIGFPRRQEILDDIADKGTFLPKGVLIEDMDGAMVEYLENKKGLSITIENEKVPVVFLTIQRWTEFTKTWQFTDKYKTLTMPFITIVRRPDVQQGQNQAGLWNIPENHTYTYMKVPTFDGIRRGIDLYKIPQPTSVDLSYEVRIFTGKMKDLNKFNEKIQKKFQARQCYLNVNGHPMPLLLESIGDESNIEDFENKRFYVQMFEMRLAGYILDEEDFEVIPTLNRSVMTSELMVESSGLQHPIYIPIVSDKELKLRYKFLKDSSLLLTYRNKYKSIISSIQDSYNLTNIEIFVNNNLIFSGLTITTPFTIDKNDLITIKVYKEELYFTGGVTLIGEIIT